MSAKCAIFEEKICFIPYGQNGIAPGQTNHLLVVNRASERAWLTAEANIKALRKR